MKRRDFIRNATALAAIPAVPASVFATPVSAALVARAEHMAGLWVHTSASMMKNAFGLDDSSAKALFKTLMDKNIVANPNAFGVAKAVVPCYENPIFAAKVQSLASKARPVASTNMPETKLDLEKIKDTIESLSETDPVQTDIPDPAEEAQS